MQVQKISPLIFSLLCAVSAQPAFAADAIYFGGDILTMKGHKPTYVEAQVVDNGKIQFVGKKDQAFALKDAKTKLIDLQGKTLIPGMIDGHGHITQLADGLEQAELSPPPIGGVKSVADIVAELKKLKDRLKLGDGALIVGGGYDQDLLVEKRHPTAAELDAAFPKNPVILRHSSGHMLVANSLAFKEAGITEATQDPEGGKFIRIPGSNKLEGLVQEVAMKPFLPMMMKPKPIAKEMQLLKQAMTEYAKYGVTTANEALAMPPKMELLEYAAKNKELFIDIVALPAFLIADQVVGTGKVKWGEYNNGLMYAGLKIALDGSPQGKTAYLTKPYLTEVPGCTDHCHGFANLTQDEINNYFVMTYKNNVQLFAHCNGDASIDMMIKGHQYAQKILNTPNTDRRTVIIHSQIMRPDQMEAYKKYKFFPSFFTNHTYYWGDVHIANLGANRAAYLSPMESAYKKGLIFANHTDVPVTPINHMFLLWTSVNRVSREGKVVGAKERVSPYVGLQALTIGGAYAYHEEANKGTLEPGKLADLVVLDSNPLKIDSMKIKDIQVLKTIKAGREIYSLN